MLPRCQRSIFHLGEEGGDDHRAADGHLKHTSNTTRHHGHGARRNHGRQRRERDAADAVVGLQILVQHGHRDTSSHSRIVQKKMVLLTARHRHGLCSFLRACSLCRRERSPNKDVYMYRGDQGFCSEECRRRQILLDEAREREAMIRKERRGLPHHHRHGARSTAATIHSAPRRLLAVA